MVCLGCEKFGMWDVEDMECSGCGTLGMLGMWDVGNVGCSGCGVFTGILDVDLQKGQFQDTFS